MLNNQLTTDCTVVSLYLYLSELVSLCSLLMIHCVCLDV